MLTALLLAPAALPARAGQWVPALSGSLSVKGSGTILTTPSQPYTDETDFDLATGQGTQTPDPGYDLTFPYFLPLSAPYQSALSGTGFDTSSDYCAIFFLTGGNPCRETSTASPSGTFTWVPDPNLPSDPPPQGPVFVLEQGYAEGYADGGDWQGDPGTFSATADDGLGDPAVETAADTSWATDMVSRGGRYTQHDGSSGTITVSASPSARGNGSSSDPAGSGYAVTAVGYAARIAPFSLTITPVGAVQDSNGNWNILIGQRCYPTVAASNGYTIVPGSQQWSVSGVTFQRWVGYASASLYIPKPNPLTGSNVFLVWNDQSQATETITCTVTVRPPTGQGTQFPVTATQTVDVYVPTWQARGVGGEMLVGTAEPGTDGTSEWLYAAPEPDSGEPGGMTWYANVSSPANAPVTFGTGQNVNHLWSENGQSGLDTSYPYGWLGSDNPSFYTSFDTPGLNLTFTQAVTASVYDSFMDYLMYEPPHV